MAVFDGGPTGNKAVETPLVVFGLLPIWTLLTVKVTVHVSTAGAVGILIPVKLIAVWPAISTVEPLQPTFPPTTAVWPISADILLKISLKVALVCAIPVGLLSFKVTVACCPSATNAGAIALVIVIRPTPSPAVFDGGPAVGVCMDVKPLAVLR